MIKKITGAISVFFLTGCSLGQSLQVAGNVNEEYKTCVAHQMDTYSANHSSNEIAAEKVVQFIVTECAVQEDAYVVAMTDLAMTITGNLVSREKFLDDEEAKLRNDLHDFAAGLVKKSL